MNSLFRQQALQQLSSPAQLDDLMRVVHPQHWLALITCGVLVIVILLWGIEGRLSMQVAGQGVLIRPRKVVQVQSPAPGQLTHLTVEVGDVVKVGDVLGLMDQPEIRKQIQEARIRLQALLAQDEIKSVLQSQHATLRTQEAGLEIRAIELERKELHKRLKDLKDKAPVLKQRLANRQRLENLGILPKFSEELLQAKQDYLDQQDDIASIKTQLKLLESKFVRLKGDAKRQDLESLDVQTLRKNEILELRSKITLFELQLEENSQIVSSFEGRILELTTHIGEVIKAGSTLASVEVADATSELIGVTYFTIDAGKKIAPGMAIHIEPSTVERTRFGYMIGTVSAVSSFPATKAGIVSLVGNAEVTTALMAQGPVIEVMAKLTPDASTFSRYQWSSSTGPNLQMTPGTTMIGRVVLEQRAPITYLLPILRGISGVY